MTINYCDFCGAKISEGLAVKTVHLPKGPPLDCCDTCLQLLWDFTKGQSLRRVVALGSGTSPQSSAVGDGVDGGSTPGAETSSPNKNPQFSGGIK